jgi:hypothetical protein
LAWNQSDFGKTEFLNVTVSAVPSFPLAAAGNKQHQINSGNRCSPVVSHYADRFEVAYIDSASAVVVMTVMMLPMMMVVTMMIVTSMMMPASDQLACAWAQGYAINWGAEQ